MSRDDQAAHQPKSLAEAVTSPVDVGQQEKTGEDLGLATKPLAEVDNRSTFEKTRGWVSNNPGTAVCYGITAASIAVVASPAIVSAPLLSAAGFGVKGVVANSAAAAAQASIGNVAASSAFATFTSAGMAGSGAGIINGALQAGAGVTAAGLGGGLTLKRWIGEKKNKTAETNVPHQAATESQAEGNIVIGPQVNSGEGGPKLTSTKL